MVAEDTTSVCVGFVVKDDNVSTDSNGMRQGLQLMEQRYDQSRSDNRWVTAGHWQLTLLLRIGPCWMMAGLSETRIKPTDLFAEATGLLSPACQMSLCFLVIGAFVTEPRSVISGERRGTVARNPRGVLTSLYSLSKELSCFEFNSQK